MVPLIWKVIYFFYFFKLGPSKVEETITKLKRWEAGDVK